MASVEVDTEIKVEKKTVKIERRDKEQNPNSY
jgi:hypothetical protein